MNLERIIQYAEFTIRKRLYLSEEDGKPYIQYELWGHEFNGAGRLLHCYNYMGDAAESAALWENATKDLLSGRNET